MAATWRDEIPPFSGDLRARFEILDLLGEGGMGRVYLARQLELDREVAIKVLKIQGDDARGRFEREAQVLSALAHPRILRIIDAGCDNQIPYIVCERIKAHTLQGELKHRHFTLREAIAICARVADALAYAHTQGIVHRDVKPDNVFLLEDGEVKLADFGLARDLDSQTITASGMMMGTPEFISPEQVRGQPATSLSDQYSLGVMLYRLALQVFPFNSPKIMDLMTERVLAPAPPPTLICPNFPTDAAAAIERALEREPTARYPTMDDFQRELEGLRERLGQEGDRVFRPVARTRGVQALPVESAGGKTAVEALDPEAALKAAEAQAAAAAAEPPKPGRRTRPNASVRPDVPAPSTRDASPATWIVSGLLAGSLLAGGAFFAARDKLFPRPVTSPTASADAGAGTGLGEARRALIEALQKLKPAHQIEELRKIENSLRKSKMSKEERQEFLRSRWRVEFERAMADARFVEAARHFSPADALHQTRASMDARSYLELMNLVDDLGFLSWGLKALGLPQPLERVTAAKEPPLISKSPNTRFDRATGFRLPRRAAAEAIDFTSHPDGGQIDPLHIVSAKTNPPVDDYFFTHAVALGTGNEAASVFEGFDKASKKRHNQVEYTHEQPLEIPPPERLEAAAVSAFVSQLDPEHRFEIYAASDPKGPFVRRIATFRGNHNGPRQLFYPVDPEMLPGPLVWIKVQFVVLPGLPNHFDDSELHQLALHVKRKDPAP